MPEASPKQPEPVEPRIEVKPAKDLEPNDEQGENVRGGGGGIGGKGRIFSDVALKNRVSPLRDALTKLRELAR